LTQLEVFFSDAANAVVDAAETVGDTAESAAKVVVKNTLCPLEKAMDDMINSIINEIDDTKKQIEGTLTRMRGKQKSISQISGLISKEGKQLTEIANEFLTTQTQMGSLKTAIDAAKKDLRCLSDLEIGIAKLLNKKSELFTSAEVHRDDMNDQIRLTGTVEVMTDLLHSFEENPDLYILGDSVTLEKAEETLKNMTERLHHHHNTAVNINIKLDGSERGDGNIAPHELYHKFHDCMHTDLHVMFKCY